MCEQITNVVAEGKMVGIPEKSPPKPLIVIL